MAQNVLNPVRVHLNIGADKIGITGYSIDVEVGNGCSYVPLMNEKGQAIYAISRGLITCKGDVTVYVLKTEDGKFDPEIAKLKKSLLTSSKNDPKKYVESILVSLATAEDKPFAHLQFQGYVAEMRTERDEQTGLQEVICALHVHDPTSVVVKN